MSLILLFIQIDLRCHHNTRYTSPPGKPAKATKKNTSCPASAFIVLKRSVKHSRYEFIDA